MSHGFLLGQKVQKYLYKFLTPEYLRQYGRIADSMATSYKQHYGATLAVKPGKPVLHSCHLLTTRYSGPFPEGKVAGG